MFKIFPDAHRRIATEIKYSVLKNYDLDLDLKNITWGAVLPDVLPKYKFIRHYKDESLDFIVKEIMEVIYTNRKLEFNKDMDPLSLSLLSKRIGIISHYLTDYACLPHAERWTFQENMLKHLKYEAKLSELVENYEFVDNVIESEDLNINEEDQKELYKNIEAYINQVIDVEYRKKVSFENDLNFSLALSKKITYFILDSIEVYSEEFEKNLILEI